MNTSALVFAYGLALFFGVVFAVKVTPNQAAAFFTEFDSNKDGFMEEKEWNDALAVLIAQNTSISFRAACNADGKPTDPHDDSTVTPEELVLICNEKAYETDILTTTIQGRYAA